VIVHCNNNADMVNHEAACVTHHDVAVEATSNFFLQSEKDEQLMLPKNC